jgi:hypothetical protein
LQAKEGKTATPNKKIEKKKMDPYSVKAGGQRQAVNIQQYVVLCCVVSCVCDAT